MLSDGQLNLYAGAYDFKFSNEQFLERLCEVIGIDIKQFQTEIADIHLAYERMKNRFKSSVFIDTGFKRAGQPV